MPNNTAILEFFQTLQAASVAPASPAALVADGHLHRHHIESDARGSLNGWHVIHLDSPASAAGGSWKTGHSVKWCSKRLSALSSAERETLRLRIEQDRARAQAEQEARHRNAAGRAAKIWAQAVPAAAMHPYLQRKGIQPGIARQSGNALVLPVVDFGGALHGLQFIQPDSQKRFISGMAKAGHFIPVSGLPDGTRPLYISEGYATAATLAAMKPDACHIAACDCGNLASVAQAARAKWPELVIVVCPDFDTVGREKAQQAAISARCLILPPPAVVPPHCTDWNDWKAAKRQGVKHG